MLKNISCTHRSVYLLSCILVLVGLPLSKFLMSLGMILIVINWIIEGELKNKFKKFLQSKPAIFCAILFMLHIVGLIYTSDMVFASKDILIKLPLLFYPLIFSSIQPFNKKEIKTLLFFFIGSVLISTLLAVMVYFHWIFPDKYVNDPRNMVVLVSHIRLGLMISFSVFILGYLLYKNDTRLKPLYLLLIFWFIGFLYLLESFTGFTTLLLGSIFLLIIYSFRFKELYLRLLCTITVLGVLITSFLYARDVFDEYYQINENPQNLVEYSPDGEKYIHDHSLQTENGYYIYNHIAPNELSEAWNERSDIKFREKDKTGHEISGTLIRYLTSKGLKKDRYGVYQLSKTDIKNIHNGVANVDYADGGFRNRLKKAIFQLDKYVKHDDPTHSSITQRLEYWRTGMGIIRNNYLIGVGTGDAKHTFYEAYKNANSKLSIQNRNRAHNQYLTFVITFGITGLIVFILTLVSPFFDRRIRKDFIYLSFFLIATLSFLWEDTLETQAGLTFFTFFYCLFSFARKPNTNTEVITANQEILD